MILPYICKTNPLLREKFEVHNEEEVTKTELFNMILCILW